jgi:hypothetical protein
MSLTHKPKAEVLPPRNAMALDSLAGVRSEMARLYRLALNGRIRSDEMTRFIYALKECGNFGRRATAAGITVARYGQPQWSPRPSSANFHAVDLIEKRSQQGSQLKIVKVRRGYEEDPDTALDRHVAAHPEDRGADVVIFEFCDDEDRRSGGRLTCD